ncbi:fimbria/pilus outer membrane usher protein [Escherichia coli]
MSINSNSIQSSISGVSGDDNQLSYGVSLNTQENGPTGYAVNGSYRSPVATLQATAGNDSRHNRQISAGISGAIVAHPFGVTAIMTLVTHLPLFMLMVPVGR